ncbi:hypothetical protein N7478_011136 [Penicillium angulare]|uniref:uncharacterized protein n=1 Tax=Penicillium angulare TaxID=116970 RepID=UPI002541D9B2|nr:uncharacterized protein N7478_011136 [Penicillium angulare]KAJ5263531.1 hypothetical protein N7478_011136 [Penicillium angulare]
MSHLGLDSKEASCSDESLLCRWQQQLEFFLFHVFRSVAPALADKCHWSCPEAAELSRLSEKVTEYFCFHHKEYFQSRGISEYEREAFCSDLHKVRQIRHFAVHRVPVNAATIAQYAKSAQHVLEMLKRLGGKEFQESFGELVNQSLETFWDVRTPGVPQTTLYRPSLQQQTDHGIRSNANLEVKAANIQHMRKLQNSAMERKLANIARMAEEMEISYTQKVARRKELCEQNEGSQQRKAERAERSQRERDEADRKKAERAQRSQRERDEADRKKAERAQRSQQERDEADRKKAERAQRSQQERDEADRKKAERAQRSQQERDEADRKKAERAQRNQQERNPKTQAKT